MTSLLTSPEHRDGVPTTEAPTSTVPRTAPSSVPSVVLAPDLAGLGASLDELAASRHRYTSGESFDEPLAIVVVPSDVSRIDAIRDRFPRTAVVVYDTARSTPGSVVAQAFAAGVDAYVSDASPSVLVAQIEALRRDPSHRGVGAPPTPVRAANDPPAGPTTGGRPPTPPVVGSPPDDPAPDDPAPDDPAPDDPAPDDPRVARRQRGSGAGARAALVLACLVAGAGAGLVAGRLAAGGATGPSTPAEVATVAVSASETDVGAIAASLEGSVVSIETTAEVRRGPMVAESTGAGTGVVFADGYILTNSHVVEDAQEVVVITSDGVEVTARVVGADAASDIAVLATDTTGLTPISVADTDTVEVGDTVVAIGNALDLDGSLTVTQGIVSALDRSVDLDTGELGSLMQTDAAISSGNSGGPLVNTDGEVVGINTAVAASGPTVQASNIGFAISIDRALDVAMALLGTAS